ncbi:MAG: 1,2-phenylacetyl-CoA epoxidase subunit PaaD [Pseudomonadota bacterium]
MSVHPTDRGELIEVVPLARAQMEQRRANSDHGSIYALLDGVCDPELPILSIWDLGILQDVRVHREDAWTVQDDAQVSLEVVTVTITPTYSGCPAVEHIAREIKATLESAGVGQVVVETRLDPAWTTDWLSGAAQQKLRAYGVAPPEERACPICGSLRVSLISEFAATACKSLLRCDDCLEPFEQFKAL